jgi:L-lactate dehydrogenase complex protein LldG
MTDIAQTRFMANIKKALNRIDTPPLEREALIQTVPDDDDLALLKTIHDRKQKASLTLLDRMIDMGHIINTAVVAVTSETDIITHMAGIIADRNAEWGNDKSIVAWNHPLVDRLALATAMEPFGIPVYTLPPDAGAQEEARFRRQSETALMGVTSADFGIAETATLTMKTRVGQPLHVSLLPSIHMAVIHLEQILENLKELYTLLKWDPRQQSEGLTHTMTFISGPSKTADIEATLVHGAHGPRELLVFVLT